MTNTETTKLPRLARAYAFHAATVEARLSSLHYRVQRIDRTFNRKTGDVDLFLVFRDDEDRWECQERARSKAYDLLIDLGFQVCLVGTDWHIRIKGYYGDRRAEEEPTENPAAPLAKVIAIAAARVRRAS